ncbi:MAG TPA: SGNH/GDSL hydrolase family protein [Polyangiales bacterium]
MSSSLSCLSVVLSAAALLPPVASAQPFTQQCNHDPDLRVTWNATPFLGKTYQLQAVRDADGSSSSAGWKLHHRPTQNWPNNTYDPDTVVTGNAIFGYSVWEGLIPNLASGWAPPDDRHWVSILTCPGGACVFSPETGCRLTYTDQQGGAGGTGVKLALVGDSLIVGSELCGFSDPPRPCATPASTRLRQAGYRVWSKSGAGQGFFSWLDVLREQISTEPAIYVLAFGTNDARNQASTPADQREGRRWQTLGSTVAALNGFHAVSPSGCAVLVTVGENSVVNGAFTPNYAAEAGAVNALLKQLAADVRYGEIELADFAAAARAHCPSNWLSNPAVGCDWFAGDQLHTVAAGDQARNDLIVQAVSRCGR